MKATFSLFSGYQPLAGVHCETFFPDGTVRPAWQPLVQAIEAMAPGEFEKQALDARKILDKHGATYNPYAGDDKPERPWELDLLPFIISPQDWQFLEQGLAQRAALLNAVLSDLYHDQSLIQEGLLPPEAVMAFPGFIRASQGMDRPFLTLLAVDLCRDIQGRWHVINDLAQVPSGLGFSLQNRMVTSQVLSRLFHNNRVKRLAPFFITLKEQLRQTCRFNRNDPEILMLSAGPDKDGYFEQALLSRYLGYPMVESGDLTVRDNRVFVKMLGGLEPVDVLLRYVPDLDCDPLALRTQAITGVPGLIQAERQHQVATANAMGTGAVENPVFSLFYPAICQRLLGQTQLLPDLPVRWCRNPDALNQVLTRPQDHFFRQLTGPGRILDGAALSLAEQNALFSEIRFAPWAWVAREKQPLATVPSLGPDLGLTPLSFACRFFICASENGYAVMPGGLAMDFNARASMFFQDGMALTKDIWVLSNQPVEPVSLMGQMDQITEIRRQTDLPSRAADNLLWLGRHLEKAESQIRLLRAIFMRLSGEVPFREMPELPLLFRIAADKRLIKEEQMKEGRDLALFPMQEELIQAVIDPSRPNGLSAVLRQIHQTAGRVRDRLSQDTWQVLSRLDLSDHAPHPVQWIQVSNIYELLDDLLVSLSAFSGLAMENITRGATWRFLDMGKRLARAQEIQGVIRTAMGWTAEDPAMALETLLELADSIMTYRYRYRTRLQDSPVMDLLLFDELNPRSLAFQLAVLSDHVDHLPRESRSARYGSQEEKCLLGMLTRLRLADPWALCQSDDTGSRPALDALLDQMDAGLNDFSSLVTQHYLSRIPTTQHFSSQTAGEPS